MEKQILDMIETLNDKFEEDVTLRLELLRDGTYFGDVVIVQFDETVELDNGFLLKSYGDNLNQVYESLLNLYNK